MSKKLDSHIQGLQCDNSNCDYSNPDIPFEQYEQFVNCPCPKCGQLLLTPQAYKMYVAMKSMGNLLTKITRGQKENDQELQMLLGMDKDGYISMKK